MKIKASNIQTGDRILAYFQNKRQTCTVKGIPIVDQGIIIFRVFLGKHCRPSSSGTIRFKSEAYIDIPD